MRVLVMWGINVMAVCSVSCGESPVEALAGDSAASEEISSEVDLGLVEEEGELATSAEAVRCPPGMRCDRPRDGRYFLTTFGGPGDRQSFACGGHSSRSTYYAASSQRFGCGTKLKVTAHGKCVIVMVKDAGPAASVERRAGGPILDVGPAVARRLFGSSALGWSDRKRVHVTKVGASRRLGPFC
jgi:hypothetical protein